MLFQLIQTQPLYILPWVVAVILSIGWHEFAHALAGYWQGDDTAQRAGRLTANPFAHMDWLGFALLVLVGFGWGKPTPYNPYNLKFKKWGSVLVAFAGPLSNVLMALLSLGLYRWLGFANGSWASTQNLLEVFLLFMANLNISLFVFNLLPIPPLDGSKLLFVLLGPNRQQLMMTLQTQGPFILMFVVILGQEPLSWVMNLVSVGFYSLFGLI